MLYNALYGGSKYSFDVYIIKDFNYGRICGCNYNDGN